MSIIRMAIALFCILFTAEAACATETAPTLSIVDCLEDHNPARIMELKGNFVFAHGALGWHATWGVLFDLNTEPPSAYETYGHKGDVIGAFGRIEVPRKISSAIQDCGYSWQGFWEDELPERHRATPTAIEPAEDLMNMSADELLPFQD